MSQKINTRRKRVSIIDFINDLGDTIGGFLVGVGFCNQKLPLTLIGLFLIVTSISIEYYKKGRED